MGVFRDLKEKLGLKIEFDSFLTMLIKLLNQAIEDPEQFKLVMIMNSDASANLKFIKILPFKQLEQLSLKFKLGEMDAIQKHVVFRYKLIRYELNENQAKLQDVCNILKLKNPSLITQINQAAMISQPYHLRMQQAKRGSAGPTSGNYAPSQASFRSIKSRAMSNFSKA